jgi:hypothetical protein
MFKLNKIASSLNKFLTIDKIVLLVIILVAVWLLYSYSNNKMNVFDKMSDGKSADGEKQPTINETSAQNVKPAPAPTVNGGYTAQSVANPTDLLPQDKNSEWAALNPVAMNQGNVAMPDLLQAGYHIGLDTIGQTLRNANLQLRSDPIIKRADIGPWNQSTIEPDLARVPLEVGQGPQ